MDEPRQATSTASKTTSANEKRRRTTAKPRTQAKAAAPVPVASASAKAPEPAVGGIPIATAASLAPSAALIGVGLLLESELLVGIAIGTGLVVASKWVPESVSATVLPVAHTTLNACYSAAMKIGEMLGDAIERVEGAVAGIGGKPQALEGPEAKQEQSSNAVETHG